MGRPARKTANARTPQAAIQSADSNNGRQREGLIASKMSSPPSTTPPGRCDQSVAGLAVWVTGSPEAVAMTGAACVAAISPEARADGNSRPGVYGGRVCSSFAVKITVLLAPTVFVPYGSSHLGTTILRQGGLGAEGCGPFGSPWLLSDTGGKDDWQNSALRLRAAGAGLRIIPGTLSAKGAPSSRPAL